MQLSVWLVWGWKGETNAEEASGVSRMAEVLGISAASAVASLVDKVIRERTAP